MSFIPFPTSGITTIPPLGGYDAFQRIRVSATVTTLFDSHPYPGGDTRRWNTATSGGTVDTSTANSNGYVTLNSGTTNGDYAVRQSWEYVPYQPGKSKLLLITGVIINANTDGTTCRMGAFDTTVDPNGGKGNGHFFEWARSGTNPEMNVVEVRSTANGVTTRVNMADWNYDKLDGTGPSGLNVGGPEYFVNKAVIYVVDQEWLGVGRVRFGFVLNGEFRYVHLLNHSDVGTPSSLAFAAPYILTAKLPVRYDIRKTATGSEASMFQICSSVQSEGGYLPTGPSFGVGNASTISLAAATYKPLIALRLKDNDDSRRVTLYLNEISVINSAGSTTEFRWDLFLVDPENVTTFTAVSTNVLDNSAAEYAVDTGIVIASTGGEPNGVPLASGMATGRSTTNFAASSYLSAPRVNYGLADVTTGGDNNSRVLVVFGTDIEGNPSGAVSLNWIEIK